MRIHGANGSWMVVATLTVTTTVQALRSYRDLTTGWSWDLAYSSQWYSSITRGDGVLSVRPIASYGVEGPSAWKSNYPSPAHSARSAAVEAPSAKVDGHRIATIADLERHEAVLGAAPAKLPSTRPHAVPADVAPDVRDRRFASFQSDAPACDDCGACYRCFNCGDGMGCSRPPSGR